MIIENWELKILCNPISFFTMPDKISQTSITPESIKQPFWSMTSDEALKILRTRKEGLSEEEAKKRLESFGPNSIRIKKRFTKTKIFFNQLTSPFILVLIIAGVISIFLRDWIDAGFILAAVSVNSILGFWQENKAENALELLKTYIRVRARVRRGGKEREIDAEELVPGDIIRVSQGDRVPADARLIYANNLEVDEAVLTGESLPESKDEESVPAGTALADRTSMIFGGTLVVGGLGEATVTATGFNGEFGKIVALVAEKKPEPTPLQRAIKHFTLRAGAVLGVLVFVLFLLGIYFHYSFFEMFLISVAVAVSVVPEGLPIAVTVILATGVQRLAAKKGVVRRLSAAEALGSATLILTDKTGTLTQAKMSLVEVFPWGKSGGERELLEKALVNLEVIVENPEDKPSNWHLVGRPLETALVSGAAERGVFYPLVQESREIFERRPFSSKYKYSVSVSQLDSGNEIILFGAPDILLEFSSLSGEEKEKILAEIASRAFRGERVLGVASKRISTKEFRIGHDKKFEDFTFDGLLSFYDPLRPGVSAAIRHIASAGVRTIIVTGDHQGTAEAVARELGMIDGKGAVLTGDDLRHLSQKELWNRADKVSVYARVTPEDKLLLTKLYKDKGEIVAVTGDGINDAPSLEEAHIGVAVGSGTDVTKSSADLVLLDDNFETLVAAIEEGRRVLDNIRKVMVYLLSNAFDELFLIGGSLLAGLTLPLTALQILFVNFFSDSFPAIALAFERGIDGLGKKPRKLHQNLFDREMKVFILVIGISTSALLFFLYAWLLRFGFLPETVRTFIFATFAIYTLMLSFSIRSLERSIFSYNPFSNIYLLSGVTFGILLVALAVYVPVLQGIFETVPLSPPWVLGVFGVGLINIAAVELGKWLFRRRAI